MHRTQEKQKRLVNRKLRQMNVTVIHTIPVVLQNKFLVKYKLGVSSSCHAVAMEVLGSELSSVFSHQQLHVTDTHTGNKQRRCQWDRYQ